MSTEESTGECTWSFVNGTAILRAGDEEMRFTPRNGALVTYVEDEEIDGTLTAVFTRGNAPKPTPTPAEDKTSYTLDLSGVTKTNNTSGSGKVKISGTNPGKALYARVTWVYTLSNGDSFAYCAMKNVVFSGSSGTFNMVSPKAPYGATLDAVQVALVDDPEADSKGAYTSFATAKK